MYGTVIDTNCMNFFYREHALFGGGDFVDLVNLVFCRGFIAIDDKGRALHEYDETCRPKGAAIGLRDWIFEMIRQGKVREVSVDICEERYLKLTLGVPSKDLKWVSIALGSGVKIIVTEDIDLFDPKKKATRGAAREKVMVASNGAVSKYLKRKHGIIVSRRCDYPGACEAVDT